MPVSKVFAKGAKKNAMGGDLTFVQISDSHIGFDKRTNPDVTADLPRCRTAKHGRGSLSSPRRARYSRREHSHRTFPRLLKQSICAEFMLIVATQLPVNGFLGTNATFGADVNLIVQLSMAGALIGGVLLAKKKRYRAHGACQATVLLLNLWMIGFEMWPSFRLQIAPRIHRLFHTNYYRIATIHAVLGAAAELLGIYIVLVTATELVPPSLRFTQWRQWMRTELVLWFFSLAWGIGTYYEWYVAPFR